MHIIKRKTYTLTAHLHANKHSKICKNLRKLTHTYYRHTQTHTHTCTHAQIRPYRDTRHRPRYIYMPSSKVYIHAIVQGIYTCHRPRYLILDDGMCIICVYVSRSRRSFRSPWPWLCVTDLDLVCVSLLLQYDAAIYNDWFGSNHLYNNDQDKTQIIW